MSQKIFGQYQMKLENIENVNIRAFYKIPCSQQDFFSKVNASMQQENWVKRFLGKNRITLAG